jgi:hypothetical protein
MKSIFYRSPLRAYNDDLANEPPYAYYGFTTTIPWADYKTACARILNEMDELARPRIIENVPHVPAPDRAVERYEAFDPDRDEMLVLVRMAFVPVEP